MATHEVLEWGDERLRLGPWRREVGIAHLATVPGTRPPGADAVRRSVEVAADRGFRRIVTGALLPTETGVFADAGFALREELHLLTHDLSDIPAERVGTRRARRGDRGRVLEVDVAAFDEFWAFDDLGLGEALGATPSSRYRVTEHDGVVMGYAVHGRAAASGYVQRVAVDPAFHGNGHGLTLVSDGLRWMRRRGCLSATVNTQLRNERAYRLYLDMGFRPEPHRLAVLQYDVDPVATS